MLGLVHVVKNDPHVEIPRLSFGVATKSNVVCTKVGINKSNHLNCPVVLRMVTMQLPLLGKT
jgi:hypothetical protein